MALTNVITDQQERTRFLRFLVVGTIGAAIDFGTFHVLVNFFSVPALLAQTCSFTTAVSSNFIWNRYWTYPDSRSKPISNQIVTFFVVNIVGLGIRTPIFAWLEAPLRRLAEMVPFLPLGFITPDIIGYTGALGVAVVVVMLWNFYVNRYWTYNDVK
ncbi:MAG: GtrA family protein [Chloroflexota bacterium]|nr:GtrA family protein [Chloroflexota bacterium]